MSKVYGWYVIRCESDPDYEHRIALHSPVGTSNAARVEDGLYRKVDFDRGFYIEFEEASDG